MDKKIKQKLDALRVEYDPSTWDIMDSKLTEAQIKDKLDAVKPAVPMGAWEAFQDKVHSQEDALDQNIADKLHQVAPAVEGWSILEKKWEDWKNFRKRFVLLRVSEVVIILLLLWGFWNGAFDWKKGASSLAEQSVLAVEESTVQDIMPSKVEIDEATEEPAVADTKSSTSTKAQSSVQKANKKQAQPIPTATVTGAAASHLQKGNSSVAMIPDDQQEKVSSEDATHHAENQQASVSTSTEELTNLSTSPRLDWTSDVLSDLSLMDLSQSSVVLNASEDDPLWTYGAKRELKDRTPIWLALYGTFGMNHIRTPKSEEFDEKTYLNGMKGLGLRFEFENGRWLLSSGMEYHRGNFIPDREKVVSDINGGLTFVTLEKSEMDFFTIPILAQYEFLTKERSSWTALAGARLHMSSKIDYTFGYEYFGSTSGGAIDAAAIHGVSDVNFTYFTVNLGVGYHYRIAPAWGVFGQLTSELFGQNNSLLPNSEKVNTLRMDVGLRYRI